MPRVPVRFVFGGVLLVGILNEVAVAQRWTFPPVRDASATSAPTAPTTNLATRAASVSTAELVANAQPALGDVEGSGLDGSDVPADNGLRCDDASTPVDASGPLATDAAALATDAAALATDAAALATDAAALATDGAALATDAAALATDAAALSTDAAAPATDASTLASDASTLATDASALATDDASTPPWPPFEDASAPWDDGAAPDDDDDPPTVSLADQRAALLRRMKEEFQLSPESVARLQALFDGSSTLGQGNPAVSRHPLSRAQCRAIRQRAGLGPGSVSTLSHPPCTEKNMVPLYDPAAGETPRDARVCIDQFEFPNIACEYPVVYGRARETEELCQAVGKRLCDAHEWEGACAGALHTPEVEYAFDKPRPYATWLHNQSREIVWAYGRKKDHRVCATGTVKSPNCSAGGWSVCGSNTYPAGSFPACVSSLGVYYQHGNAAEHMNLPLAPDQLGSRGGTGATEMKGSWFIFLREEAHEDDCRWRAKDWHPSALMDENSHRNYHLGLRCCKDVRG